MSRKNTSLGLLAVAIIVLSASSAFAEENQVGNSLTGFFKRLFNYPVKATQETAKMTGTTLQNTGEKVLAKTGENTASVLQGDLSKTPAIVTDAVVGAAETTGQTVVETVQVPVKAAEEEKAS